MGTVAVVAMFHETNTFSRAVTDRAAFEAEGWYHRDDLLHRYAGSRTVVGGFLEGLRERGHQARGAFGAYAVPAGTVSTEAFEAIRTALVDGLRACEPFDGILVELHGALVTESAGDPESLVCEEIRQLAGHRPVVAVTDFHANMTARRLRSLDLLTGYRTNPHIDTWETGRAAARHLADRLDGAPRPCVAFGSVPVLAPAIAQATSAWPLVTWLLRARELERRHDLLDVTLHGGYAYADVPHAGMAVTVTTRGARSLATDTAAELCQLAWDLREDLRTHLPTPAEAVASAVAGTDESTDKGRGLVAFADTGDNINGGSAGDEVELLAAARESPLRCLTTWTHPELLRRALDSTDGAAIVLPPVLAEATGEETALLHARVDGTFVNRGPMATGRRVDMGRSVVLRLPRLDILLQGRATQPNDPEMFRSAGLTPETYDAVLLKGASALRAGWSPLTRRFIPVATAGVTDSDLIRLPYERLQGQVWPLTSSPVRTVDVSLVTAE
ncbi:M81 family metallopeptidase [Actinopolymorpha alba]|uniref:M81 family metallopeptidase n=1 Tax=Actinopolymorpha alba TaxID=533267 RepID=UPI00037A4553|nr:M81 family metallopeptidase [Actinopolymorpha alba]